MSTTLILSMCGMNTVTNGCAIIAALSTHPLFVSDGDFYHCQEQLPSLSACVRNVALRLLPPRWQHGRSERCCRCYCCYTNFISYHSIQAVAVVGLFFTLLLIIDRIKWFDEKKLVNWKQFLASDRVQGFIFVCFGGQGCCVDHIRRLVGLIWRSANNKSLIKGIASYKVHFGIIEWHIK